MRGVRNQGVRTNHQVDLSRRDALLKAGFLPGSTQQKRDPHPEWLQNFGQAIGVLRGQNGGRSQKSHLYSRFDSLVNRQRRHHGLS